MVIPDCTARYSCLGIYRSQIKSKVKEHFYVKEHFLSDILLKWQISRLCESQVYSEFSSSNQISFKYTSI